MCNPAIFGLAISAVSMASNSAAESRQAVTNKSINEYNAQILRNEAEATKKVAYAAEQDARQETAQLLATQQAAAAARGVQLGTGTIESIKEDTALIGEVNAMRIRDTGAEQADALEERASFIEQSSDIAYDQAQLSTLSTTASQGASVASKWYAMQ